MEYTLKVKQTGRKSGKYHYQVIDENGKLISERSSNREYVACTIDGRYYFGRLDLIGKGDHGKTIAFYTKYQAGFPENIRYLGDPKEALKKVNSIAYIEDKTGVAKIASAQAARIKALKD